jgi:hypothetical protein
MAFFLIGILSTAALVFVAFPLINSKKYQYYLDDMAGLQEHKRLRYLHSQKELVYDNIRDLEQEYQMGKLSDDDFAKLREGLLLEAQQVVTDIDSAEVKQDIEDLIEKEVESHRKTR